MSKVFYEFRNSSALTAKLLHEVTKIIATINPLRASETWYLIGELLIWNNKVAHHHLNSISTQEKANNNNNNKCNAILEQETVALGYVKSGSGSPI